MTDRDWYAWHLEYDEPGSSLANRLDLVRERIGILLDVARPGPLTAVSMVAGQGRDLIPVLATHPRGRDVAARLVELDSRNAAIARAAACDAGLDNVDVVTGDAAELDHYREYAPADLVLMCGLFGNISDADIKRTIGYGLALTKPGGSIIWARGRTASRPTAVSRTTWKRSPSTPRSCAPPSPVTAGPSRARCECTCASSELERATT